jgi:hypothetical protein
MVIEFDEFVYANYQSHIPLLLDHVSTLRYTQLLQLVLIKKSDTF